MRTSKEQLNNSQGLVLEISSENIRDEIAFFFLLIILEFGISQTDILGAIVFLIIVIIYYLIRLFRLVYEHFFKHVE